MVFQQKVCWNTIRRILEYWLNRAYQLLPDGSLQKLSGKALYAARGATMRKVAAMIYKDFAIVTGLSWR